MVRTCCSPLPSRPSHPPSFPPQDLANYKYCGVSSDILGEVDPPAPAPPPPPGSPPPQPPPPPPSSSPASRLWQILTQLKSLSGRQIVVAAGGFALIATLGFCVFRCCVQCGLCPCLPACCGGGRRRRQRRALADDDGSDDDDRRDTPPRRRRGSVAAALAALRARRAEAEARLFEAVEGEEGTLPPSLTSLADVASLAGGAWRGPAVGVTAPTPSPDAVASALVEALRRAAASSPLSPPPASQASAEMAALLAALQGGRQGG